ncbi:MAG TPA: hypothetical protein VHZ24_20145 [Pirellulales bacterium]|jgi:hypothetical protein|nr:hypothetical protein [Pirellulales bacterium]
MGARHLAVVAMLAALLALGASAADVLSERRTRIAQLDDAARERLLDNLDRYQHLTAAEQQQLRDLDAALATAPDGDDLRTVLRRYNAWLNGLPAVQRAELLATPEDRRIERIEQMCATERRLRQGELSPVDVKVVTEWLEQLLRRLPQAERQRAMMRLAGRGQPFDPGRGPNMADLTQLRERLSPAAQQRLAQAATPQEKQELIHRWLRQGLVVLMSRFSRLGNDVSEERLRQFYETEISEAERERLLTLPADEMQMQLRRMYQLSVIGGHLPRRDGEGFSVPPGPRGQQPSRPLGNRAPTAPKVESP